LTPWVVAAAAGLVENIRIRIDATESKRGRSINGYSGLELDLK
jgi:hypothetical protein